LLESALDGVAGYARAFLARALAAPDV